MSDFKDLDEVLQLSGKQLPIGGKVHEFPDRISAKSGTMLILMQRRTAENPEAAQKDGVKFYEGLVGEEAMAELMTDVLGEPPEEFLAKVNLDGRRLLHVFQTLTIWHLAGEDMARELWNDPGKLTALKPTARSKGKGKSARQGSRA